MDSSADQGFVCCASDGEIQRRKPQARPAPCPRIASPDRTVCRPCGSRIRSILPRCDAQRGQKTVWAGFAPKACRSKTAPAQPLFSAAMSREGRQQIDWPSLPASWGRGAKLNGGTAIQPCGRPGASRKSLTPFFLLFLFSFRPSRSWHSSHPNLHVRPHQARPVLLGAASFDIHIDLTELA